MKNITITIARTGKTYPLAFTIEAFEHLTSLLPEDAQNYGEIMALMKTPSGTCEVCAELIAAGADYASKTPTADEIRKGSYLYDVATIQKACAKAILHGLNIETKENDGDIDETLMENEKNAEKGAGLSAGLSPTA